MSGWLKTHDFYWVQVKIHEQIRKISWRPCILNSYLSDANYYLDYIYPICNMTITQFIECAIEGGWKYKCKHQEIYLCKDQPKEGEGDTRIGLRSNTYAIMLDPNAWRAVGKVKLWDKLEDGRDWDSKRFGFMPVWEYQMHQMIAALISGKTIEEFIATL